MKDKVFKTLGASNHCKEDRELNDFYASNPNSINELLSVESFDKNIWECAVGQGHLSQRLKEFGYNVFSSDIIDRGYPNTNIINFLENDYEFDGDIITNPPYKFCTEFIIKALNTIKQGHKVAFLLKLQTLEGQKRYEQVFSKQPPRHIYIYINRQFCAKNGNFNRKDSAICFAWFVWEKGFTGKPEIEWIWRT